MRTDWTAKRDDLLNAIRMNMIGLLRWCTGLACYALLLSASDAQAQMEYLNPGVDFAFGGYGLYAEGPGNATGVGGGVVMGNDHASFGMAYDKSKSGDESIEFGMVYGSVIEKGENKPIGMVVTAGYSFADGMEGVVLVPVSITAFRRVMLDPSAALIPEIGVAKVLPIGNADSELPPVFTGAVTFAAYFQKHGAFLAGPQAAYSDGKWSVGFGVALIVGTGEVR